MESFTKEDVATVAVVDDLQNGPATIWTVLVTPAQPSLATISTQITSIQHTAISSFQILSAPPPAQAINSIDSFTITSMASSQLSTTWVTVVSTVEAIATSSPAATYTVQPSLAPDSMWEQSIQATSSASAASVNNNDNGPPDQPHSATSITSTVLRTIGIVAIVASVLLVFLAIILFRSRKRRAPPPTPLHISAPIHPNYQPYSSIRDNPRSSSNMYQLDGPNTPSVPGTVYSPFLGKSPESPWTTSSNRQEVSSSTDDRWIRSSPDLYMTHEDLISPRALRRNSYIEVLEMARDGRPRSENPYRNVLDEPLAYPQSYV